MSIILARKKAFFLSALSVLLLSSCGSGDAPVENSAKKQVTLSEAEEDSLFMSLSVYLVPDPQTTAEKENNLLVNYAMDKLLEVERTSSGLFYHIQKPGEGNLLQWGDRVKTFYRGTFPDGQEFDNAYKRGEPLSFYIGNVIDGWNEGLQLLRPGGRMTLLIPSHLAYGEKGLKNSDRKFLVPPDQPLIFDIYVSDLLKKAEEE